MLAADTDLRNPLPKLGAVCAQWKRCGRDGCRCARGEAHGPYYYVFWRAGGKLRKRYLRLADADAVRAGCEARRARERRAREVRRAWDGAWRALRARLREAERHG
jgi:hypothetical protein